jgi:hypothetical protein
MSDITTRDAKGRFQLGNKPLGHRPKGARDRHCRNFLAAFESDFAEHGAEVIRQVRAEQPAVYLKIAADLLPREAVLDIDVTVLSDVTSTLEAFRVASNLLGVDPQRGLRRLRKVAPQLEYSGDVESD